MKMVLGEECVDMRSLRTMEIYMYSGEMSIYPRTALMRNCPGFIRVVDFTWKIEIFASRVDGR